MILRFFYISFFLMGLSSPFFVSPALGQSDVREWKKASVNGGINTNATYYESWGMNHRRPPFFWMVQANLNIDLGPLSLPFSVSFNSQKKDFRYPKPFNHFGLSPRYKSVTAHLGYRSMQFSEFTMAGVEFLGAGIEVDPEKSPFRVSALYGRLQKAGTDRSFTGIPQYERWGGGLNIGYKNDHGDYSLSFFKAEDHKETLSDSIAAANEVSPGENFIMGVLIHQAFMERWTVDFEYALSAYTYDTRMPEMAIDEYTYINNFGSLYTPRASSRISNAFSSGLNYQMERFGVNLKYRRVAPDYASMGAPFLMNDFKDITAGANVGLWQGKVNVGASGGVQTNNLDSDRAADTRRLIGSANAQWNATDKLNFNASYANFNVSSQLTAFVQSTDGFIPDTLIFRQVNSNANVGINYSFGQTFVQNVAIMGTYQKASDNQGGGNTFYNLNAAYQWNDATTGISASAGVNANNNVMTGADNQSVGPTLTLSKALKSIKLRNSFNISNQQTYNNGDKTATISSVRLNSSWSLAKKQSTSLSASYMSRKTFAEETKTASEMRITINYNYRF